MAGQIVGAPQVQMNQDGGIALTWEADIPPGEKVLYYTVNIYNANTNTLINTVKLSPAPSVTPEALWDQTDWDQGDWA